MGKLRSHQNMHRQTLESVGGKAVNMCCVDAESHNILAECFLSAHLWILKPLHTPVGAAFTSLQILLAPPVSGTQELPEEMLQWERRV